MITDPTILRNGSSIPVDGREHYFLYIKGSPRQSDHLRLELAGSAIEGKIHYLEDYRAEFLIIDFKEPAMAYRVNSKYTKDGRSAVSKDQFMDLMAEHYPDYLEWLLFHPKWL